MLASTLTGSEALSALVTACGALLGRLLGSGVVAWGNLRGSGRGLHRNVALSLLGF